MLVGGCQGNDSKSSDNITINKFEHFVGHSNIPLQPAFPEELFKNDPC